MCPVGVPPGVRIYSIDGPMFFGAAATFERTLAGLHDDARVLILRLGQVPMADVTAMQALADLTRHFQSRGVRVLLCEANARINEKLANFGLLGRLGQADARISLVEALSLVSSEEARPA